MSIRSTEQPFLERHIYVDVSCIIITYSNSLKFSKTQIHIFHNRLLGEVAKVLQLFLVFSDSTSYPY